MIRTTAGIAIVLMVVGCGSSLGRPEDLAKTVGVSYVHEEYEIRTTCAALERAQAPKPPGGAAAEPDASSKAAAIQKHLRADLRGRAGTLLSLAGAKGMADA